MTTTHPILSQGFPAFAPSTSAVNTGFMQWLRRFRPLDWILGPKVNAQAELTRCRVSYAPATCFTTDDGFDIRIDYQFWVEGVCHQGRARLPWLPAEGPYQSKRDAAKAVLRHTSFPVTYRTGRPSRARLERTLPL